MVVVLLGACSSKSNSGEGSAAPSSVAASVPCNVHPASAGKAGSTTLSFAVSRDGKPTSVEQFTQDVILIGRVTSAQIRLDDPAISRSHAMVEVEPAGIHLTDLGSDVGTLVNGQRVAPAKGIDLVNGDSIVVGPITLKLTIGGPPCPPR